MGSEQTGTTLTSTLFAGTAGQVLAFQFNYVTSDGSGFADYAWVRLLDVSFNQVALLFTARTHPSAPIVPGFSMPAPSAILNPSPVTIVGGAPAWAPLGTDSGRCFNLGCGYSGWVQSTYSLTSGGNFYLQFGVVNWQDSQYASGLAFDGLTIGGQIIGAPTDPTVIPEPATMVLLATGLMGMAGVGFIRRRRQR